MKWKKNGVDKRKGERKKEKEYQWYRIPICKVYESSHKRQCNKASIRIDSSILIHNKINGIQKIIIKWNNNQNYFMKYKNEMKVFNSILNIKWIKKKELGVNKD